MRMRRYEDLLLWQKAMQLAKIVYLLQKGLPKEEMYGLGDQIRRAVVSVPSNIAEGYGRGGDADFKRFLAISRGSLFEVKTQLQLAEGIGLLKINEEVWNLIEEVGKLINGLVKRLAVSG
jgi:four helix bundle protein